MNRSFIKLSTKIVLALLVGLLSGLTAASAALAWGETQVYLEQREAAPGTVVVDLMVEDVSELFGVEFRLNYDPAVLAVLDAQPQVEGIQVDPGQFLPVDQGFVVMNQADPEKGTVSFAMTLLSPAPAVSGTGSLGRVTFKVLQDSPTTVDITQANLVSSKIELIPTETSPLHLGQSDVPWLAIGLGALVLGVLAAGGGLWLVKKVNSQPAVTQQVKRQESDRSRVGSGQRAGSTQKGQTLAGEASPPSPPAK